MTMETRHDSPAANRQAQGHRAIALGWLKKGRVRPAILSLEKALDIDPRYLEARLDLAQAFLPFQVPVTRVNFVAKSNR